jgi:hypothetical protein
VNPSLHVACTGLEHNTRIISIVPHPINDGGGSAVEIDENVTGVVVIGVRLDVDVAPFAVSNAQESNSHWIEQLGRCPQPFSRERSASPTVDQTDQIQIVRHGRNLAADRLHREHESAIDHAESMRRFNARAKVFAANGNLSLISVSHHRGAVPPFVS